MAPRGRSLELTRTQILAFRRCATALDARLPGGAASLRRAAWAGLQDSMPRAALLSLHARVSGVTTSSWEHPSLVQVWGPRFSDYVVAARDLAVFSLGRLSDHAGRNFRAVDTAARLHAHLAGRRMPFGTAGDEMGVAPNSLRYAAPTGTVLMRWDGARQPVVWTVPAPSMAAPEARLELARRYLHVFGPGSTESFRRWAGIGQGEARRAFVDLGRELTAVQTPVGEGWVLTDDLPALKASPAEPAPARLLPSGDSYFLLWSHDREILLPDASERARLWTTRVWPGALLVGGEVRGTWRRAGGLVSVDAWRRLTRAQWEAVEAEVLALPLAGPLTMVTTVNGEAAGRPTVGAGRRRAAEPL